jgi:hypothetical protein
LLSAFPFLIPFLSPFVSLYLLGTLLAVIGSCPHRSQVARKLISPFPSPSPYTPHSKIPTPWGFPEPNMHITKTTSRTWLTRSSTLNAHELLALLELIVPGLGKQLHVKQGYTRHKSKFCYETKISSAVTTVCTSCKGFCSFLRKIAEKRRYGVIEQKQLKANEKTTGKMSINK